MRLILNIRGINVIDLEVRWPTRDEPADDGPTLHATGGGGFERAEPYGDPATQSGFGFTVFLIAAVGAVVSFVRQ